MTETAAPKGAAVFAYPDSRPGLPNLTVQLPPPCNGIIPFLIRHVNQPSADTPTNTAMNRLRLAAALALAAILPATEAPAQAWAYPSFQPPRVITREYNFGIADADRGGAAIVFQWREQSGPQTQFSFDIGIADSDRRDSDLVLFGGVGLGHRLGTSTPEVPIDFLLTAGIYLAVGDINLFRIPIGVSIGHRFDMGGEMSLTPYVHPRISIDVCGDDCDSDIGLTFDLGANFQISRSVSIRGAAIFTGSNRFDGDGFGISLAWTPPSLARRR